MAPAERQAIFGELDEIRLYYLQCICHCSAGQFHDDHYKGVTTAALVGIIAAEDAPK